MIIEFGHFAVILALVMSALQAVLPLIGAARDDKALMQAGRNAALAVLALVVIGFAALMRAHVTDDFSVLNVAMNSHTQKPLLYKITGTWASHEGSMLLWILILSIFGAALAVLSPAMPLKLRARAIAVQGMMGFGFLVFILFASNPFARLLPAPAEGLDLNPLLQDPGLAFHPPFLYLGYVGFSSVFALAAALLLSDGSAASTSTGETPGAEQSRQIKYLRPYALVAWSALTFGIAMGSWWAYYELGWGGFWFWDPVENAALLPWLAGTALLHSVVASVKRGALMRWTILLAILTFSLSLLGTFLVRSGVLTSVHAFALDPKRGVFVLILLALAVGGALALYAARARRLPEGELFAPVSRETALLLNNLFLGTACATLLAGTLYPILLDALHGGMVSVGAPYFNATVLPLLLPVALLMVIGPLLNWRAGDLKGALARLKFAFVFATLAALTGIYIYGFHAVLGLVALALGVWVVAGTFFDGLRRRFEDKPRLLAHAGLGIAIIGMSGAAFSEQYIFSMHPGAVETFGGYRLEFAVLAREHGPNFDADRGTFNLWRDNRFIGTLMPAQRFYPVRGMALSDIAIHTNLLRDYYLVLGDAQTDGARTVRLRINPLMPLIWIGGAVMAVGGLAGAVRKRGRKT